MPPRPRPEDFRFTHGTQSLRVPFSLPAQWDGNQFHPGGQKQAPGLLAEAAL